MERHTHSVRASSTATWQGTYPSAACRGRLLRIATPTRATDLLRPPTLERPSNNDGNGYLRSRLSWSSVNVMTNPVRVAPIPKLAAHAPTNIFRVAAGFEL